MMRPTLVVEKYIRIFVLFYTLGLWLFCLLKDLVGIIFRAGKKSMPLKKTGIIRDQYREELVEPKETVAKADMKSLKEQKRVFARERRLFGSDRNNNQRRIQFVRARRVYKKVKYHILRKGQEEKIYKLQELESKDSKLFWKSIRKLSSTKFKGKPNIGSAGWVTYFKKLLNINQDTGDQKAFQDYVHCSNKPPYHRKPSC